MWFDLFPSRSIWERKSLCLKKILVLNRSCCQSVFLTKIYWSMFDIRNSHRRHVLWQLRETYSNYSFMWSLLYFTKVFHLQFPLLALQSTLFVSLHPGNPSPSTLFSSFCSFALYKLPVAIRVCFVTKTCFYGFCRHVYWQNLLPATH